MTTTVKPPRATAVKAPKGAPRIGRSSSGGGGGLVLARPSAQIEGLVLGGEPRVHLIPPAVLERKKGKDLRRRLGIGVVGVIVLVAAGLGLATVSSAGSQNSLLTAQQTTTSILQQQAKYGVVTKVKADAAAIKSSQQLATSQEILWAPFYDKFAATLPSGATITNLTANLAGTGTNGAPAPAATAAPDPSTTPVATITGTISMKQAYISQWLNTLQTLTGFIDVTPTSVTGSGSDYAVSITMHINSDALANRFTKDAGTTK